MSYMLKTFQLIVIILSGSFFSGVLWFIFVDYTEMEGKDNFTTYFELLDKSNSDKVITLTYFFFTSLSTVGLGDYHPRSSAERFVCAFILLFGVNVTSMIIENFMRMIMQMNNLTKSFEES